MKRIRFFRRFPRIARLLREKENVRLMDIFFAIEPEVFAAPETFLKKLFFEA